MARLDPEAESLISLQATLGQAFQTRVSLIKSRHTEPRLTCCILAFICGADILLEYFGSVDLRSERVRGGSR